MDPQNNKAKLADHIIFIGFMGSGKSAVSKRLARFEKMHCVDMDAQIEREAHMKITDIFAKEGEDGFRVREYKFLQSMIKAERCILSCGGGVIVNNDSRALLKQLGTVIYLKVDAAEAISRISRPETRPLLNGKTSPAEILAGRIAYYKEAADITINTGGKGLYHVVSVVQHQLKRAGKL